MGEISILKVMFYCFLLLFGLLRVSQGSVKCGPKEFQCTNGNCISMNSVCDVSNDCRDESDEEVCYPFQCHPAAFQCLNGRCITRKWVRNGFDDCGDRFDEYINEPHQCHPVHFQCSNGRCKQRFDICNGRDNCGDNSDEEYCNIGRHADCPHGWSECPNNRRCLPSHWMCDGYPDCPDGADETECVPFQCHPSSFQCTNGKCIARYYFCNGGDNCGDNSDEEYCNIGKNDVCPKGWSECAQNSKCFPSHWICDGYPDCPDESDEKNCAKTTVINADSKEKSELKRYLLSRRKSGSSTNRWGSEVHRIAVALQLADTSIFTPGNTTGEEIRYELMKQLFYRLPRNKISSQELAMYIHALMVSCLNPRDIYGGDMVQELRNRVEATGNYTNPFLILVLCNAGDTMTTSDVDRVKKAYESQHRPVWTDSQALSSMALSCIASRNSTLVDDQILVGWLEQLKKRQFNNGTIDNFRTTALISQALLIHGSYKRYFDMDSAIKVLVDHLNERKTILNTYYALPVIHGKSLLNISSSHCSKELVEEEETMNEALDVYGETIIVQYSIWIGDDINLGRTWRFRILRNSTIYDVIESVSKIENNQNVQYDVVDGKPYLTALNDKVDDPELGTFWFIYLKTRDSEESPNIVGKSPVDIKVTPNQEIILWYKHAPWNELISDKKQVTSY